MRRDAARVRRGPAVSCAGLTDSHRRSCYSELGRSAEMLCAGCIALVASAALGEHWRAPRDPQVWWAWSYLVVFGSLIGFSSFRYLVERVSPTLASTYAYVNPPVALLAWAHSRASTLRVAGASALESEVGVAGPE